MLNLSENKIYEKINTEKYSVFSKVVKDDWDKRFRRLLLYMLFVVLLFMFLPWTQNVSSKGYLTTLFPDQRPQTVHSMIGGMLQKWYVKEGDFVNKGDTLVYISEVKSDYFDPELIARTSEQVDFKENSIQSYGAKIQALEKQKEAFKSIRDLKLQQYKNKIKQCVVKVKSDSVDFISLKAQLTIAERQFKRTEDLHKKGLK
jgi:multidrug efflux pump subunit AcrA (membrane-fusion protein)